MDLKGKQKDEEKGYDFSRSITGNKRFEFGAKDTRGKVDISLAHLFQRLTVECSGILANPQWKHFRHMELLKTDQIRLSNGIWRSWYMQFQRGMKPLFCKFEINPEIDRLTHCQPQAIVLEGKYWKRTNAAVAMEYRKWRLFATQKKNWANIRRMPTNVPAAIPSSSQSFPQPMQAESSDFKMHQIFQAIDDFPEAFFMDIPRPGDERSYMRPLVESAEIIQQQPYLGMLNPQVDEMVFEPMEVMFPFLGLPSRLSGSMLPTMSFPSQQPSIDQSDDRMTPQQRNNPQSYSDTPMQYQNQASPYVNIPMRGGEGRGGAEYPSQLQYDLNPGSFLSMPVDSRPRPPPVVMDMGTPPISSIMKSNSDQATPTTPYQSPQSFGLSNNQQGKINTLVTQIMSDGTIITNSTHQSQIPPTISAVAQSNYGFTNPSLPPQPSFTTPDNYEPKVPSDSTGKTELELELIAHEMKQLEQEHLKHLCELEIQQQVASQQYVELLQEYLNKSGCQPPSQQQHQVLMSVLSDPTSLNILKAIFKDHEESADISTQGLSTVDGSLVGVVKKEMSAALQGSQSFTSRPDATPMVTAATLLSPVSDKEGGAMSDFQTRLIQAAAAQGRVVDSKPAAADEQQTPDNNASTSFPLITSPPASFTDTDLSPALMKKFKNARNLTPEEKKVYQELRRQSHITAEQRRRGSIKNGFDHLQSLVINPSSFPSGKISKATILEKTIDYIQAQHHDRDNRAKRIQKLKEQVKVLNEAVVSCQEKLPASGAPVTKQRFEENRQHFRDYIRQRTQHNYKFWIYSIIIQQLFDSYNSMVSTGNTQELRQSVMTWFEQSCGLPALRPVVMSSLQELSMKTSILSDPGQEYQLPDYRGGPPPTS